MEISKHGKHLNVPAPHFNSTAANEAAGEAKSGGEVKRAVETQPQRLLERLQGNSEVRNRLLVEIKAKVQAGEYFQRAAVEKAAEQIVGR
jgi:hypothetical protein